MKLGEALSARARQAQKLDDLRNRIRANALVQEGDQPAEDPELLLADFLKLSEEHAALVLSISKANTQTGLMEKLHEREHLRRCKNIHEAAATAATPGRDAYRYMRSEVKHVPAVSVAKHRLAADEFEQRVRELDSQIQEANWLTDIE